MQYMIKYPFVPQYLVQGGGDHQKNQYDARSPQNFPQNTILTLASSEHVTDNKNYTANQFLLLCIVCV